MKKNHQAGLSLLEVIISIMLLAFTAISVIRITQNAYKTSKDVTNEDNEHMQMELALSILQRDLSHLHTPLMGDSLKKIRSDYEKRFDARYSDLNQRETLDERTRFAFYTREGLLVPRFFASDEGIEFFTNAHRSYDQEAKVSNFAWIKYELRTMKGERESEDQRPEGLYELTRAVNAGDPFLLSREEFGRAQVVLQNIKELRFTFWNPRGGKYTPLQEVENGDLHVKAIKLEFIWVDRFDYEQQITRIFKPLHVGLDSHE